MIDDDDDDDDGDDDDDDGALGRGGARTTFGSQLPR